jgi:hypothetical protein
MRHGPGAGCLARLLRALAAARHDCAATPQLLAALGGELRRQVADCAEAPVAGPGPFITRVAPPAAYGTADAPGAGPARISAPWAAGRAAAGAPAGAAAAAARPGAGAGAAAAPGPRGGAPLRVADVAAVLAAMHAMGYRPETPTLQAAAVAVLARAGAAPGADLAAARAALEAFGYVAGAA